MKPTKSILSFNEMTNTIIVTNFFKTGVTRYFIKSSTDIAREYYRNDVNNPHLMVSLEGSICWENPNV